MLAGEGYGNIIMATPLMAAVAQMGYSTHVLVRGNYPDAKGLLRGWSLLAGVHDNVRQVEGRKWDMLVSSLWYQKDDRIQAKRRVIAGKSNLLETHEAEANMTGARELGWTGPMPSTHVESEQVTEGLPEDYIAVCPGYGGASRPMWKRKAWPHWKELLNRLDRPTVAIGGKGEELSGTAYSYFGTLNIRQAAGVLKGAKAVVAVDNGLAHISAAVGTRTVVLFGGTSETKNRPLGRDVRVVAVNLSCRPCQMTDRWQTCKQWRCMEAITPQMVLGAMN